MLYNNIMQTIWPKPKLPDAVMKQTLNLDVNVMQIGKPVNIVTYFQNIEYLKKFIKIYFFRSIIKRNILKEHIR